MKKGITAAFVLILMITAAGCGAKNVSHNTYSEIYKKYNNMKSYTAQAEITVFSGSAQKQYTMQQYYVSGDKYKAELIKPDNLAGTTCIFSGGSVWLKPSFGKASELENYIPAEKSYIFVPDFFSEYYKSEQTAVFASSDLSGEQTKLTSTVSGSSRYRFEQSLWIDNKTLLPSKMETYDINGNPVIRVVFTDFQYNKKIDDTIFNTD